MRGRRFGVWFVAVVVAVACSIPGGAQGADGQFIVITGKVFEGSPPKGTPPKPTPLKGAKVIVYTGKPDKETRKIVIKQERTHNDGSYEIAFPRNKLDERGAFNLYFEHTGWHDDVLPFLTSEELPFASRDVPGPFGTTLFTYNELKLNKILALREGPKTFPEIAAQIRVYEFRYALAAGDDNPAQALADLRTAEGMREKIRGIPNPDLKHIQTAKSQQEAFSNLTPQQEAVLREALFTLYQHYGINLSPPSLFDCTPQVIYEPVRRCRLGLFRR